MEAEKANESFENYLETQPLCANEVKIFLEMSEPQNIFLHGYIHRHNFPGAMELTDVVRRGAISVFGWVYEFCEDGIKRSEAKTPAAAPHFALTVMAGRTSKSMTEFQEWIVSQRDKFTAPAYRPTSNNGIHFVKAACEFLDVETPPVLQLMVQALAELLQVIAHRAAESSTRSLVSSSSGGRGAKGVRDGDDKAAAVVPAHTQPRWGFCKYPGGIRSS